MSECCLNQAFKRTVRIVDVEDCNASDYICFVCCLVCTSEDCTEDCTVQCGIQCLYSVHYTIRAVQYQECVQHQHITLRRTHCTVHCMDCTLYIEQHSLDKLSLPAEYMECVQNTELYYVFR